MKDRIFAILFFSIALILLAAVLVWLVVGLIEWLQSGNWRSVSVLEAAYEARLIRARWLLSVDWGWRLSEWLDAIPLPVVAIMLAPLCWRIGLYYAHR